MTRPYPHLQASCSISISDHLQVAQ